MKRTSKKLLSFILAVVMVVTSCSVGFTAFAQETNPDDTYWHNTTDAQDAYQSIQSLVDYLVPTILGINVGEGTIGSLIGMTDEEIKNADLQTVVAKASPLLMSVLGSSDVSAKDFLTSHSSITGISESTWKNSYSKYYSYLDGTDDDTMSFYSLYEFCENNVDNSNEDFANYCKDLVGYSDASGVHHDGKLETLLKIASVASKSYDANTTAGYNAYVTSVLNYSVTTGTGKKKKTTYPVQVAITDGKTVSEIGDVEVKYNGSTYKINDLPLTDESGEKTAFQIGIDICNQKLAAIGSKKTVSTPAEALMYYYTNSLAKAYDDDQKTITYYQAAEYIYLANIGGTPIKTADGTELTVENFETVLNADSQKPAATAYAVYNLLFDLSSVDYNNLTLDTFASSSYEAINEAVLLEDGEFGSTLAEVKDYVNKAKITDDQLTELHNNAVSGTYETLHTYINNANCTLSTYAKSVLNNLYESDVNSFSLFNNEIAISVDAAKAYMCPDNFAKVAKARNNGENMGLVEYINDIISGVITYQEISGKNILSVSYVSRSSFDFDEVVKYNDAIKPATEGYSYSYSTYAVPSDYTVIAVNSMLNTTIAGLFTGSTGAIVNPIIDGLLETKVTLYKEDGSGVLNNIWQKLYDAPIETVIDLVPVLVALVDEVIVPMVLNQDGDAKYEALNFLIDDASTLLGKFALKNNNITVGISTTSFDLNTIIPALLTLISADGGYDAVHNMVQTYGEYVSEQGITITDESFDKSVLRITGIYVADKALTPITNSYISNAIVNALKDSYGESEAKIAATGIMQAVDTVINSANTAVNNYLAEHKGDVRYIKASTSESAAVSQSGLNNIGVALPYLMNEIGKEVLKNFGVDSDWSRIYEGCTETVDKEFSDKTVSQVNNTALEELKSYAADPKPAKILENIVDTAVGTWLDSLLDLLNDTLSTENTVSDSLGMVTELLNALGGLGETSIITDVLNGFFDLTRDEKASFTLSENEKGFVGLSTESAMFLIANIDYKDGDTEKGILPLVMGLLVGGDNQTEEETTPEETEETEEDNSPTLANSSKVSSRTATPVENTAEVDELITKVDKFLNSLLENTKLNGFKLDSNDNILASVLTAVSRYIGSDNTSAVLQLLDKYLAVFESTADSEGNLPKDVYNTKKLNEIVISTYQVLENIVDYVLYDMESAPLANKDNYRVVAGAIDGVISPESVAMRMTDEKASKSLMGCKDWSEVKGIDFSFSKGDKDAFYDGLGQSVSGIAAIVSVLLTKSYTSASQSSNYYSALVYPVLNAIATKVGTEAVAPETFNEMDAPTQLIEGIMMPLANIIGKVYDAPATYLLNIVSALGDILSDSSMKSIAKNAVAPINHLYSTAVDGIVGKVLKAPILEMIIGYVASDYLPLKIDYGYTSDIFVNVIGNISVGGTTLIDLLNLKSIDWSKLASSKSAGETLCLVLSYLKDTVLQSPTITSALDSLFDGAATLINSLTVDQIITIVDQVLSISTTPTEAYWTFKQYAAKAADSFVYPTNITASEAEEAVDSLDNIVDNIFPLLNSLGVTNISGLEEVVNDNLYTNSLLTTIAKGIYGSLDSLVGKNATVATVVDALGISFKPEALATYLVDDSYGTTYSSAASTLRRASSWNSVSSINWGFTDGSGKAEQGFINGLAAILRPFNTILTIFLADSEAYPSIMELGELVKELSIDPISIDVSDSSMGCKLIISAEDGVIKVVIDSNNSDEDSVVTFDLGTILTSSELKVLGTNGYQSAVIPLLEAFKCSGIKTYSQYLNDYTYGNYDSLITDILNPLFGFVDDVVDAPVATLTSVLPNLAYFIDNNGLGQLVKNLLAPVTAQGGLIDELNKEGLNVDYIIKAILGKSLGDYVTDALGIDVDLTLNLTDLSTCNIQDILIPVVKKLLADKLNLNLKLSDIDWTELASLGTSETFTSKTGDSAIRINANKGEVLITVLRYVADVLIRNSSTINKLLQGISAIKKNATICKILDSVFTSINSATKDDIVRTLFYFLAQSGSMNVAQDSFFDYSNFITKSSDFSFGNMDEDFCRQLAPMLDGLVSGLLTDKGGLLGLITDMVYTDDIISTIAVGLYSAIENVKVGSLGSLTSLLAKTGIDFTTSNMASLLTDSKYGKTYASAASTIKSAGSWSKVNKSSLSWGVTDRESFLNALCAILRPLYGVLDVLLNDSNLGLFDLVSAQGSDGYSSTIVPLLEAFGCYNIKTQYDYRMDMSKTYDSILLDILNPIMDKVEDILNAPVEMVADILPNLSLFFANDGLLQIIENLLTPVSALLDAVKPVINVNNLLSVLGVNINSLLSKIGVTTSVTVNVYDLKGTLAPLISSENVVKLINGILGSISISGQKLGIVLPDIDWYALASHGTVVKTSSQAATIGQRLYVQADQDETLIAVLRFVINTINYEDNYNAIVSLVSGLLGSLGDSVAGVVDQVLGMLQGDADTVIENLVDLLQSIAG